MNKTMLFAGAIALMAAGCTSKPGPGLSNEGRAVLVTDGYRDITPGVKIVYTANLNGEIEPCGCRGNPTGGIQRRWNLIEQKVTGERLVIDSGDVFYKSAPMPPFLEKQWNYQASALVQAYNEMGVEVITPGELDFAAGIEQFEKLRQHARFKIVSANIYRRGSDERLLPPYVIVKKNGKNIALFGLLDETIPGMPDAIEVRDHLLAAKEMVALLRKQADVVIALAHIGLENSQKLAREIPGIDAIFTAHTQSFLIQPEKVGDTLIFEPSFRGQHVGVFEHGENSMYQADERFESPSDKLNPMDKLLAKTKVEVAKLNAESDAELMGADTETDPKPKVEFQTFTRCIECHAPQHDFHKKTAHFRAFETLLKAGQGGNLECLKCHTVGAQMPGGWSNVKKLVLNASGKAIEAESFAKSLPQAKKESITKISKAFINVQCETCHGPGNQHPFAEAKMAKPSAETCLQCHTPDRAPKWHKNGKPDMTLIKAKIEELTCPK